LDADEEQAGLEECAGIFYDPNLAKDEDALQTHSTRFTLMSQISKTLFQKIYLISITLRKSLLLDHDMVFGPWPSLYTDHIIVNSRIQGVDGMTWVNVLNPRPVEIEPTR
jgi:hypothetical protein